MVRRRRKAVVVLGEWRSTSHIDPLTRRESESLSTQPAIRERENGALLDSQHPGRDSEGGDLYSSCCHHLPVSLLMLPPPPPLLLGCVVCVCCFGINSDGQTDAKL